MTFRLSFECILPFTGLSTPFLGVVALEIGDLTIGLSVGVVTLVTGELALACASAGV